MEKTRKWQSAVFAFCMMFVFVAAVMVSLPIGTASADDLNDKYGKLVLSDNTAKYSITAADTNKNEWEYNRELNLWTCTLGLKSIKSITATIDKDSPENSLLAFEYLVEYNRDASEYPEYDGDEWTQEKSYISVQVTSKDGGEPKTYRAGDNVWHDDFNIMTVPVKAGDTVVISAINNHNSFIERGSSNYLIHGLALPSIKRNIKVTTGEHGTVTAKDSVNAGVDFAGNAQDGVTTFSVPLGASVTLTPHANENFSFSDWRQSEETVSYEDNLHVDNIQTDVEYDATFAQDGGYDLGSAGKFGAQWQKESDNSFYIHSSDDPTKPEANVGSSASEFKDTVSMYFYVEGMQEVSFDWWCYFASRQGVTSTGQIDDSTNWSTPGMVGYFNYYVYVDDFEYLLSLTTTTVVEGGKYNGQTAPASNSEANETTTIKLRIQSEGIHKIEFKIDFVSSYRNEKSTNFTFIEAAAGVLNLTTQPIDPPQSSDTKYTVRKLSDDDNVNQWEKQGDDSSYKIEAKKDIANFASDLDIDFVGDKNISFDWMIYNAARSNFIVFVDGVPTSLIEKSGVDKTGKYNQLVTGDGYGNKHHRVTIRGRYILLNDNNITITNLSVTGAESTEGSVQLDDCGKKGPAISMTPGRVNAPGEDRTYIKWKNENGAYRFDGKEGIDAITEAGGYSSTYNMALSTLSMYYEFDGRGELSFDFWLWAKMQLIDGLSNIYLQVINDGNILWQRGGGYEVVLPNISYYFYGDAEKQLLYQQNGNKPNSAQQYTAKGVLIDFDPKLSEVPQLPDDAVTFAPATVAFTEDGHHKVEFRFGLTYGGRTQEGIANTDFAIKNISFTPAQTHTVTIDDYDARLGTFYYATRSNAEGAEFGDLVALAPGQTITILANDYVKLNFVEATATKNVIVNSSVAANRLVRTKFVGFDAGEHYDTTSAEFQLTDDVTVTPNFNQTAPQPYLWSQINVTDEEPGDAILAQSNTVIKLPYGKTFDFRIFAQGYEGDTEKNFEISINGVTSSFQAVKGNEGMIAPPEGFVTDNLFVMVESNVQETLRIEVTYKRDGFSDCSTTIWAEFVIDEVAAPGTDETHKSIYNNLFSQNSDVGAYVYAATDTWSPSPAYTQEGTGIAFTSVAGRDGYQGSHPNIASASDNNNYTYYGFIYFSVQNNKTGLLSIDVRLDGGATGAESLAFVKVALITQQDSNQSSAAVTGSGGFSAVSVLKATQSGAALDEITNPAVSARAIGDGWWRISVLTGEYHTIVLQYSVNEAYALDAQLILRNLTFVDAAGKDNLKLNFKTSSTENGVSVAAKNITKSQDLTVGDNQNNTVSFGDTIEFTATVPDGFTLYGWTSTDPKNSDDETFTTATGLTYSLIVTQDINVTAWIDKTGAYALRVGGSFYTSDQFDNAMTKASTSKAHKSVVALKDFEISGEHTIPAGVTLLIPYGANGRLTDTGRPTNEKMGWTKNASEDLAWGNESQYKYLTVTLKTGAKLKVEGTLGVGGIVNYTSGQGMQGHTSGAYSQLVLEKDSLITVTGTMDVYGRVLGANNGKGSIDVQSGGKLYQPFLILDFAGGTNTLGLFMDGQTPFERFAMVNIECPFTIHYGAQLLGHASLWVETMSLLASLDQPFISDVEKKDGTGNDTFVMLKSGSSVTVSYDPTKVVDGATSFNGTKGIGQTTMIFNGGATFSYMRFSAMGITIFTNTVTFAIPYNFNVELNGAKAVYDTATDFKLLPGSSIKVGAGATLNIKNNVYVFDALINNKLASKWYPTSAELTKNGHYTSNANLIIDGTLVLNEGNTFAGAIQTSSNTGRIEIKNNVTLQTNAIDGNEGTDYYATYELTTKLYDKAHTVIASPVAGKNYTAAGNADWTLPSVNIAVGKEGATQSSLTANMHGAWKVEHSEHKCTWGEADLESKNATDWESDAKGSPYRKGIKHQCSELGCEVSDVKTVVYAPQVQHSENTFQDYNSFIYDGTPWTEEDIKELLTKYYTKEETKARNIRLLAANAQPDVDITVTGAGAQNGQMFKYGTYSVTITLNDDNYIWLINSDGQQNSGTYIFSNEFTFTLEVKAHTLTDDDLKYDSQVTYKGADFNVEDLHASIGVNGHNLPTDDYTIEITTDNKKDAGTLTLKFSPKGQNVTGEAITKTVTIAQKEATIKAVDTNSPEKEDKVELTVTQSGILGVDNDVWTEIQKHLKLTVTKDGKEVDFNTVKDGDKLTITVTWDDEASATTYAKNYNITFETGIYTITSAVFKGVEFKDKEVTYNGQNQKLEATGTTTDMKCTYTYTATNDTKTVNNSNEGVKDAGTYEVKVNITYEKEGKKYETTLTATLTITKKKVTVTITPQNVEYDGENHSFDTSGTWYNAEGICEDDEITFSATTTTAGKDAKSYDITVTPSGDEVGNYDFTYSGDKTALTITKKVIKVSVKNLTSVYGEAIKPFEPTIVGEVVESDTTIDITKYLEYTCDVPTNKNAGTYNITLKTKNTNQLTNYDIQIIDGEGTYTISKRDITITIEDQNDVYGYNKNYAWNTDGWTVDDTTTLASGDNKAALKVQLVKPAFTVANKYDITATCGNANYNVTFKKGTYTLAKQPIEHNGLTVIFVLQVNGEDFHNETFKFEGKDFVLSATVYVTEKEMIPLNYTLNLEKLTKPGSYKVIVTVDDERYEGSAEYAIDILTAEGFSQNLFDVLTKLEEIAGDAEADLLTATEENFALVKAVKAELAKLSEEELEMGEKKLSRYVALVETWDDAADIDTGVIESAKALADSPLRWLFVVTQMSSLICALYVIGKGGLLLL